MSVIHTSWVGLSPRQRAFSAPKADTKPCAHKFRYLSLLLTGVLMHALAAAQENPLAKGASESDSWRELFISQLQNQPGTAAGQAQRQARLALADDLRQPLFNPELESEFEREGQQQNYRIGLTQRFDLANKAQVQARQADEMQGYAEQQFQALRQQQLARSLEALVRWQSAQQQAHLASERESQLRQMLTLIQARQASGDLGRIDAELALLGLSSGIAASAQAEAELERSTAQLRALLPDWPQNMRIAEKFWPQQPLSEATSSAELERLAREHPQVMQARQQWRIALQQAELTRRAQKTDPTMGLNLGRQNDEPVLALTLSLPLQWRNKPGLRSRASAQQAIAAEAEYERVYRQQLSELQAGRGELSAFAEPYQAWQRLIAQRTTKVSELLAQQWRQGDLNTTDYLQALQQHTQGLSAGIALEQQFKQALINWWLASGQLPQRLNLPPSSNSRSQL